MNKEALVRGYVQVYADKMNWKPKYREAGEWCIDAAREVAAAGLEVSPDRLDELVTGKPPYFTEKRARWVDSMTTLVLGQLG